ncbi:hypothetical protein Pelo_16406 [Pelomyxa schiedti]|nr:hypothetical protein Pelo_16406 [Pelomyxa schiedti]
MDHPQKDPLFSWPYVAAIGSRRNNRVPTTVVASGVNPTTWVFSHLLSPAKESHSISEHLVGFHLTGSLLCSFCSGLSLPLCSSACQNCVLQSGTLES